LRHDRCATEEEGENVATSVYSRALQKAAELVGGQRKLSRHLQVPEAELQKWIGDQAIPPTAIFLRAIDLILDETAPPAGSEPGDAPAPRESAPAGETPGTRYLD
jgi:hypothetical protein